MLDESADIAAEDTEPEDAAAADVAGPYVF